MLCFSKFLRAAGTDSWGFNISENDEIHFHKGKFYFASDVNSDTGQDSGEEIITPLEVKKLIKYPDFKLINKPKFLII
ncbi:hypothetical protein ES703_15483 [subsurface metagenome]